MESAIKSNTNDYGDNMTFNSCSVIQGMEANNRRSNQNDMTGQLEQRNETQRGLKYERPGDS
jgi:hypothetical protein